MGKAAIIGIIVLAIIIMIGALFVYSYTQLSIELADAKLHSIDWTELTWSSMVKLGLHTLSGDWIGAAFELINGINMNLEFIITNNGILPVYIPNVSYDVLVNNVSVGNGYSQIDMTIYPQESKEIISFQNIQKNSLAPVISSIANAQGVMEIKVKGTAMFKLIVIDIPVPFESSKKISVYDEIRNKLNEEIQKNKPKTSVSSAVGKSLENALSSIVNELFGSGELDLNLSGQKFTDSIYKVGPGAYTYVQFSVSCTANIQGGFIAADILGNDIIVYILDDTNFANFEKNNEISPYYFSGKVQSDVFDVTLTQGDYYIVMSNTYSTISTKNVQLQAASLCQ